MSLRSRRRAIALHGVALQRITQGQAALCYSVLDYITANGLRRIVRVPVLVHVLPPFDAGMHELEHPPTHTYTPCAPESMRRRPPSHARVHVCTREHHARRQIREVRGSATGSS